MAVFHWLGGHSIQFADALNWSPQGIPGAADDALIDNAGAFVFATGAISVARLALAAEATLTISGAFAVAAGSAPGGIAGVLDVNNGSALDLGGAVLLTGTIALNAAGVATALVLTSPTLTLSGGGQLILSDSAGNAITGGPGDTLVNAGVTISGAGQIGAGQINVVNQAGGVIAAIGTRPLIVSVPGQFIPGQPTPVLSNAGTMEALAGSTLEIQPGQGAVIQNVGGVIAAAGAGAEVDLGGFLIGGTLRASAGGEIVTSGTHAALDGLALHPVTIVGTLAVAAHASLALLGTIHNTGAIVEDAVNFNAQVLIDSPVVTLTGGGRMILAEGANNSVAPQTAGFALDNLDNTISGAGLLGGSTLTLVNAGTINANRPLTALLDNQLSLDTGGNVIVNTGLIEATSSGGMRVVSDVANAGGTILASGNRAIVDFDVGASVIGGTLKTIGAATIEVGGAARFDGLSAGALTNAGLALVVPAATLDLLGSIVNSGTLRLQAVILGTGTTELAIRSQSVTLSGGGKLLLDDRTCVIAGGDFDRLVNLDNTISGLGTIGDGVLMPIFNGGTIAAVGPAVGAPGSLVVDAGGALLTNTGLLEATRNSALVPLSTVVNAGGTIAAIGAGALVLVQGATLEGGVLRTAAGGAIRFETGSALDGLNDGAITNAGTATIDNGARVELRGSIVNTGLFTVSASASPAETEFAIDSPIVTLSGGGKWLLADPLATLSAEGSSARLVNLDNTIAGAGTIGNATLQFSDGGRVIATAAQPLNLAAATCTITAAGLLQAQGAGGLLVTAGIVSVAGTVEADSGSAVTFQSSALLANDADGVLLGGTWRAIAGAGASTITVGSGVVRELAATVVLSGAGAQFLSGFGAVFVNAPLEHSLTSIDGPGALRVLGGRDFAAINPLTVGGLLQMGGGTLQDPTLTLAAGGRLIGFGVTEAAIANAGRVEAQGGVFAIGGAVAGTGTLQADAGATLVLGAGSNTASVVLSNGTVAIGSATTLRVVGAVDPASTGAFSLASGARLEVQADTAAASRISFLANARLIVDAAAAFGTQVGSAAYAGPRIEDFIAGDKVDLKDVPLAGAGFGYTAATGLLQITKGAKGLATLAFDNAKLGAGSFHLGNDGTGHILLTHG